jgi:hypothetical protein
LILIWSLRKILRKKIQVKSLEVTEVYHGDAKVGDVFPIKQFGGKNGWRYLQY